MVAVFMWLATPAFAADGGSFVIARDGKVVPTVYIHGPLAEDRWLDATRDELYHEIRKPGREDAVARLVAKVDLVDHIRRITGAELKVVVIPAGAPTPDLQRPAIVIGSLANELGAKPKQTTESKEAFRIVIKPDLLLIGGETDVAARHGVYHLLGMLGCDWVMPGEVGIVTPKSADVSVDAADIEQAPAFFMRYIWYRGYTYVRGEQWHDEHRRFQRWMWRQQANQNPHPLYGAMGHMSPILIKRHQAEFDADPTLYALVRMPSGELVRRGWQVEETDPRIAEMYIRDIRQTFEEKIAAGEWTAQTKVGFGMGPADGMGYSESFMALSNSGNRRDPIAGELDRTDSYVLLANRILENITKDYPNAHVGFYSYAVHADYPARYQPHPNLVQIFAPISYSRFHSIFDQNSVTQPYYHNTVENWKRLAAKQGNVYWYRGYNWNLADNLLPYTKVRIWGEELPFYRDSGMVGLTVEATKQWGVLAASNYVFMKLAWNPDQKWQDLLADFCHHAYGPAAEPMRQYHLALIERQHGAGLESGSYHAYPLMFDQAWIANARSLFEQAMTLAQTEQQRTLITDSIDAVGFLDEYLAYVRAANRFDFQQAKANYEKLKAHWHAVEARNSDVVADEATQYFKRFIDAFVDATVQYSAPPYRLVTPLPDELETIFDPYVVGDRLNLANPAVEKLHVLKTRTYSSTWDAQGLSTLRDGAVWYRWRFDTPQLNDAEALGLLIGGVEDEARVWLNGKLIGGSGRRFSHPFAFDLSEHVKPEGENLLAIQVIRNSKANELGVGGIIRPSFLFAGPKLEKPAPEMPSVGRVLPGGEIAPD